MTVRMPIYMGDNSVLSFFLFLIVELSTRVLLIFFERILSVYESLPMQVLSKWDIGAKGEIARELRAGCGKGRAFEQRGRTSSRIRLHRRVLPQSGPMVRSERIYVTNFAR